MKEYILRKLKTTNEPEKYREQLETEKELFRKEFIDSCLKHDKDFIEGDKKFVKVITGHLVGIAENDITNKNDVFQLMATISTIDYSEIKIIEQVIKELKSGVFDKDNLIQELEKLTLEPIYL